MQIVGKRALLGATGLALAALFATAEQARAQSFLFGDFVVSCIDGAPRLFRKIR